MHAEIEFKLPSEVVKSIVFSLNANKKINRGNVLISGGSDVLRMSIDTPDITAMRAALNTHIRLLDMLINSWEVVENARSKTRSKRD